MRYFFHLDDGTPNNDIDGTELSDLAAVKSEASRLCGTMLADAAQGFWVNPAWQVRVTDSAGRPVLSIAITGRVEDEP